MIEPLLNRTYVQSIQITMAEAFGVSDRGRFYDRTGAIRDVLQNHILQDGSWALSAARARTWEHVIDGVTGSSAEHGEDPLAHGRWLGADHPARQGVQRPDPPHE